MNTMKTENYLRELYFILFAQKRIIIWTTLAFVVISVLIAFLWPPTYSAAGSILVKGKKTEKSPEAIEITERRAFPLTKEDLSSEVQILTSPDVISQTIKTLQQKNLYKKDGSLVDMVYSVQSSLRTDIVPASNVIEVVYYSKNPKEAVSTLEALLDQYVVYRMGVYNPSQAEMFFSQQADRFKEALEKQEKNLIGLVETTGSAEPQKELEKNILIKQDLEMQLNNLKNDSIDRRIAIEHLEKALRDRNMQYFSFIDNKPINDFSAKLEELFIERGKVVRAYNEKSDKVKLIDRQIDDTYALLKSEVKAYKDNIAKQLQIVNSKIDSIQSHLAGLSAKNTALQQQIVDTQRITREAKLQEFSYETFAKRREEARINNNVGATNVTNVSILSRPFPSNGPVFPRPVIVIPLGLLIGFIIGSTFGFLREFFDHTFKKPSDVHGYAGLPVIFSIPAVLPGGKSVKLTAILLLACSALLLGTLYLSPVSASIHSHAVDTPQGMSEGSLPPL